MKNDAWAESGAWQAAVLFGCGYRFSEDAAELMTFIQQVLDAMLREKIRDDVEFQPPAGLHEFF